MTAWCKQSLRDIRSAVLCDHRNDAYVPHSPCVVQDKPTVDLSGMRPLQHEISCTSCVHRRMSVTRQPLPRHSVYAGPCCLRGALSSGCTGQGYDVFAGILAAARRCPAMLSLCSIPQPAAVANVSRGSLDGSGTVATASCARIFVGTSGHLF